jgi:hypothetical protein
MRRLIVRTARRAITRQELWNGNREPLTGMFRRDPRDNLVRWSWMTHGEYAERYASASADLRNRHLTFRRVRNDAEVDELLASAR